MEATPDSSLTFALDNLDGQAPLHHRYPRQTKPQPAYLELDEDGRVRADWCGEIGNAVPMTVWHRRTLRWKVPCEVRGDALRAFLASDPVRALLERVNAGHWTEWDGSNHVGRLTEDAQGASDRLDDLIARELSEACVQVWEAGDWLPRHELLCHWDGSQPLDEVVALLEKIAAAEGVVIEGDVREEMLANAAWWVESGQPGLTTTHITELIRAGRITDEEATEYAAEGK